MLIFPAMECIKLIKMQKLQELLSTLDSYPVHSRPGYLTMPAGVGAGMEGSF